MSAVYGLVDAEPGRPVAERLAVMREALSGWGPHGSSQSVHDGAGFGFLLLRSTPEAEHEAGPQVTPRGAVVTAAARLDNRDELLAALAVPAAAAGRVPDGELARRAYERWGEAVTSRLHGDWALAAYDPSDRRLWLARDQFGQTALYYWAGPHGIAFASGIAALQALPGVPRGLDELRVAEHLVGWATDGARTVHPGLLRLPPGHALSVRGTDVRTTVHWDLRDVPDVRERDDDAYVARFLDAFSTAVRTRLRTADGVASTLSSGLDSGMVTALAARERADAPLVALTAVPAHPEVARTAPRLYADEWPLAARVATRYPNVDHHRVDGADRGPLAALRTALEVHHEIVYGAGNLPWAWALLRRSRELGCGVLLTGQLGNGGISWSGVDPPALDLLLAGDPAGAAARLRSSRTERGRSWRTTVGFEVVLPLRVRLARQRARLRRSLPPSYVAPSLAARLELRERVRAAGAGPWRRPAAPEDRGRGVLLPGVNPAGAIWHEAGAAHGLEVRDPTADVRLLELLHGMPAGQFRSGAQDRWLVRRAAEGLLPPEVQWGHRRGAQWADLPLRLTADAPALDRAVRSLARSDAVAAHVDTGRLLRVWTSGAVTADARVALEWTRVLLVAMLVADALDPGWAI